MGDITHRDLLDMQRAITNAVDKSIDRSEQRIHERIEELKEQQDAHAERTTAQGREITQLRTLIEERTKIPSSTSGAFDLSGKQKAALVSGAVAILAGLVEALRYAGVAVLAWFKSGAPGANK